MSVLIIQIGEKYYTKDPQSTELGRKIVTHSIELIDKLGFEEFTFKKVAEKIGSTEASIYRYFENKLKLLIYLTSWYWAWMQHVIDYKTHHITDNELKLKEIFKIICHSDKDSSSIDIHDVDTSSLRRVVASESDKTYLTKQVDAINNEGLFKSFKSMCRKIAQIISKINPKYPYSHALVSTLMEAIHQQAFFAKHLPSLTEINNEGTTSVEQQTFEFINDLTFKLLK